MVKSADNTAKGFLVNNNSLATGQDAKGGLDLKLVNQCQDIEYRTDIECM